MSELARPCSTKALPPWVSVKLDPGSEKSGFHSWVLSARNQSTSCWYTGSRISPGPILSEPRALEDCIGVRWQLGSSVSPCPRLLCFHSPNQFTERRNLIQQNVPFNPSLCQRHIKCNECVCVNIGCKCFCESSIYCCDLWGDKTGCF